MMNEAALTEMGFGSIGKDCLISDRASFYNCANIHLGDHCRIDDFCVIAAGEKGIHIGRHVHVAVFCSLIGKAKIELEDFCGLSSRVAIYSSSDDYSGSALTNPTIPDEFTNVTHADVHLEKHVIIGAGSVILPGVTLHEGAAVGAMSLIRKNCEAFYIYAGNPAKKVLRRSRKLLNIEANLLKNICDSNQGV